MPFKLISYPGFPHGMPATETATINKDILEFINGNRQEDWWDIGKFESF